MAADRPAAGLTPPCRWCGEAHGPICPWVKSLEFVAGTELVAKVEFFGPGDWATASAKAAADAPQSYPRKRRLEE